MTYEPTTKVILEPVINDPAVAARVSDGLAEMCGADVLDQDCGRWYASETFSRYMEKCPGALGLLGIKNEKLGSGAPTITANSTLTSTPWSSVPAPSWCSH